MFALGFCVGLLSGRVPYDLGFAIGLGALLALLQRALALALVTSRPHELGEPRRRRIPGLAGLADGLPPGEGTGSRPRGPGARLRAALLPILVLALAFPEGGYEPFAPSAFWPALAGVLLIALLLPQGTLTPRGRQRAHRGGAVCARTDQRLCACIPLSAATPRGSARCSPRPLLAGVLWERHRLALCLLAPLLLYWQLATPISDTGTTRRGPFGARLLLRASARRAARPGPAAPAHDRRGAFDRGPLGGRLPRRPRRVALARGWERQLDTRYAALFYRPGLTAASYAAWLRENRVAYVALPDARLDYAGSAEGALIARGLPYLREVWRSAHWRLYVLRRRPRARLHTRCSGPPVARVRLLQARLLPDGWLDVLRQVSLFALAYLAYRLVRGLVEGDANAAFHTPAT